MPKSQDKKKMKAWSNSKAMLLRYVDNGYIQSCSISVVSEDLQKSNKDAYAYLPSKVSIGPRYKGSGKNLLLMEEIKIRCMLSLFHRIEKEADADDIPQRLIFQRFEECCKAIWKIDEQVRASYAEGSKLEKRDLATNMLVDGCFLLELLISKGLDDRLRSLLKPPGPAPQVLKDDNIMSDLMLLENQIPVLVLHKLSQTLFPHVFRKDSEEKIEENDEKERMREEMVTKKDRAKIINNLALSVLGYPLLQFQSPDPLLQFQSSDSPHILDLVCCFVNGKGERETDCCNNVLDIIDTQPVTLKLKRCASKLQAAGVTIKLAKQDTDNELSCFSSARNCFGGIFVWFGNLIMTTSTRQVDMPADEVRGLDFDFKFRKGKLEIAEVHITKTTNAKWRNVIAWEHYKKNKSSNQRKASPGGQFTSSALIFNGLICCADDVKLLKDKKILVDHVKMSNEELGDFFRAISVGVDHGVVDSRYFKMVDELNNYSTAFILIRKWKTMWHLFRYRIEGLWKFMRNNYNFVATLLAVLTIVQTAYAIIAYHFPK